MQDCRRSHVTLIHRGCRLPELLNQDNSTRSQPLEPASSGLLKGERVSERETQSKPWQGKHTLSDSLQHLSFTSYNKGFTISLQHKMDAERSLKKLFHGKGHHSWRWCMENERHRYALTCSSFLLTHWPRLLSGHCQKQFLQFCPVLFQSILLL